MEPPKGYDVPEEHVFFLKKSLYGLKQAGLQWYLKLKSVLTDFGLNQVICKPNTFIIQKVIKGIKLTLIIPIYVDNMFPIRDTVVVNKFQKWIGNYFNISASGKISYFLGIWILQERGPEGKLSIDCQGHSHPQAPSTKSKLLQQATEYTTPGDTLVGALIH